MGNSRWFTQLWLHNEASLKPREDSSENFPVGEPVEKQGARRACRGPGSSGPSHLPRPVHLFRLAVPELHLCKTSLRPSKLTCFFEYCQHSSKLIKPKEEFVGISNLQPVYQKHRSKPELSAGFWSVCSIGWGWGWGWGVGHSYLLDRCTTKAQYS